MLVLLWRTPLLLPLVTVAGIIDALGGEGTWGWVAALVSLVLAQVLRLRRVFWCCLLCGALVASSQYIRRQQAAELCRMAEGSEGITLSGVVVRELGSGCILETGGLGVRVALRGDAPWRVADVVRVTAQRTPAEPPPVEGMFSTPEWMRREGLAASLICLNGEKLGESHGWSRLVRIAGSMRSYLADRLAPPGTENDICRQVLCSLVLGEKARAEHDTLEMFRRSGCLHAFAVSGLHVGIVAGILWALLRLCRIHPAIGRYVLLGGVGAYVVASGLAVPALRAYLMLAALTCGLILRRRTGLFNTWCFAALLILLIEPWQLWQPGFQLSFVVYAGICLGVQYGMRDRAWFGPDDYIPARIHTRAERRLVRVELFVRGAVIVSLCAWLVSLPLAIAQFHVVNTVSYLTNIAITPLLPVVMFFGLCALALGSVPLLGAACHYMAMQSAGWLVSVVGLSGLYPQAYLPACPPAAPGSALVAGLSYGKSFCILGNPGILLGDVQREDDARYRIEPALFHSGYTVALICPGIGEGGARAIYRRSWPAMQEVEAGAVRRCYRGAAGEFHLYFPPQELPARPAGNAQPIVLWITPAQRRILYIGNASMSTLEAMPKEERRAEVIILGSNAKEPVLEPEALRAMGPERLILLPSAIRWEGEGNLGPVKVERMGAEGASLLRVE